MLAAGLSSLSSNLQQVLMLGLLCTGHHALIDSFGSS